jgi:hypothetical protein
LHRRGLTPEDAEAIGQLALMEIQASRLKARAPQRWASWRSRPVRQRRKICKRDVDFHTLYSSLRCQADKASSDKETRRCV